MLKQNQTSVESEKSGETDKVLDSQERMEKARGHLAELMSSADLRSSFSPIVLTGIIRFAEFVTILIVGIISYVAFVRYRPEELQSYALLIPAMSLAAISTMQALDLYHIGALRAFVAKGFRIVLGWSATFLMTFSVLFFVKPEAEFGRGFFLAWFGLGFFAILTERLVVQTMVKKMTRQGRLDRRTAIVGGGDAGARLIQALTQQADSDLRICGVFDDRNDSRSTDLVAGYPKLGNIENLVEFARKTKLDLVIFSLPVSAEARLLQMLRKLWVLPIDIRLAAHSQRLRFRPRNYSYVAGMPVFDMVDKPIADWDVVLKWLFDRVVGALMLILMSPIMLLTAIAIKLDTKGPILFKQRRYGFNNEVIEVYKFRSMFIDKTDATASKLVTRNDPRVTKVGRFIRKTSIDELPQLFNVVFKGDLSLIGPRPHAIHSKAADRLYDEVVDGYFARHRVKPGITGWAQINGWRGETDTEEKIQKRVECDLYYIENWSVFLDAYILVITPFALFKTENAY